MTMRLETLRPMLIERGWLTDADSEASAAKTEPTERTPKSRRWNSASRWRTGRFRQLEEPFCTLYSNQHILRRMTQSDALYIDRQLVERLDEAQTLADWEARFADGLAAER